MLRLFDRGQREEAVFVAELRGIGAEVIDTDEFGKQWRVSWCGGHAGGSLDGCVRGLPGGSKTHFEIVEYKTHNANSFKDLTAKGVKASKRQHYDQVQTYMDLTGMTRANYFAVNKDTDELYYERIHYDAKDAKSLIARGEFIVFSAEPPPKLSNDPSWFQCYGCQHHAICHDTAVPLVHCRTCAHATPTPDGQWLCEFHHGYLTEAVQRAGCTDHRYIPILLERIGQMVDADAQANWVDYRLNDGELLRNGEPGLASTEIAARFVA